MQPFTESATGVKIAGLPFKVQRDGNGVEHKIIDLDNEDLMPREGQIVFEANKRSSRIVTHGYKYSCVKDKASDVMVGIFVGIHPKSKDLRWLNLTLGSLNTFDLSIKHEREKAIVLKYSSIVEGSPNISPIGTLHLFRIHDSEKQANFEIRKIHEGQRAISIAMSLYGEDLSSMARNLGIMPETSSFTMLTAAILRAAQEKPSDFLNLWENPQRELITIFKRCLDTGVITHTALNGYMYEDKTPIGHSEPLAIDFLSNYRDIAAIMDAKSREKLRQSEKAMAKSEPVRLTTDVEIENTLLKKQLGEMQMQLSTLSAQVIRTDPEAIAAIEKPEDLQVELEELKQRATNIGGTLLRGLHLSKPTRESISRLEKRIADEMQKQDRENRLPRVADVLS